jgi:uncharacterized protein involved in exopolysaccharide biosynthesis
VTDKQPPTFNSPEAASQNQLHTEQQPLQGQEYYVDGIDPLELWRGLMHGKWIIIGFIAAFSIASIFYALSLPNMYKSAAILAPTESSGGGLTKLAGQLGGLASLAGINLGAGGSNKTAEALEILQSWAFIEEFIQEQNIAPQVFAVRGWNEETNELIYDTKIYNPQTQTWTREPTKGKKAEPSSWELFENFVEYLNLEEGRVSGFTSLNIEYYSPEVAKAWVDALVIKINTKLQVRESQEAEKNIAFLKEQIEQTSLASMQSVFYDLIEEQTKTLMLAKGSTEYVLRTVSESRVPEKRSKPGRALICVVGAFLGGFLGVCIALLQYFIRKLYG